MKSLFFLGAIISLVIATNALSGWLRTKNGNTYYIETKWRYNWYQAIHACATRNLTLVAIETKDQSQELSKLLNSFYSKTKLTGRRLWTGGHDNAVAGQYVWITSGNGFSYTNWADGEPNRKNDKEHCVEIRPSDLKWNDAPCTMSMGYICEGNNQLDINELARVPRVKEVTVVTEVTEAPTERIPMHRYFRIG